jgi:hypothetical protein
MAIFSISVFQMSSAELEIKQALEIFIDGIRTLDYEKISQIFYKDGLSIDVRDSQITWVARDHWRAMREQMINAGKNPGDEWARFEIRSIEIIGNAASVIVDMSFGDGEVTKEKYVEFFHLLKCGDKWKIVNKIYPA